MSQRTRNNGVIMAAVMVMLVALVLAALVSWMGVTILKDGLSPDDADAVMLVHGVDLPSVVVGSLSLIGGALGLVGVGWLTRDALREHHRHGN